MTLRLRRTPRERQPRPLCNFSRRSGATRATASLRLPVADGDPSRWQSVRSVRAVPPRPCLASIPSLKPLAAQRHCGLSAPCPFMKSP